MFKKITPFLLLATLFLFWIQPASAVTSGLEPITDPEKPWTITFNEDVKNEQANLKSIFIQSANKVKHEASIRLSADSKQIIVVPEKPYRFGTEYTLVIPKGLESANGDKLKEDTTKQFQLKSTYIDTISANWNFLATNIIAHRNSPDVVKMTVSLENTLEEITLHRLNDKFSHGMQGLAPGDTLIIRAYDKDDYLLDTQYYDVK